jgi:hypothetical protein
VLILAIPVSDELQVTDVVRFRVPLFEKVPTAVSCMVVPGAMLELTGVMDRETNTGGGPVSSVPQPGTDAGRSIAATITIHDRNLFCINPVRVYPDNIRKLIVGLKPLYTSTSIQ